MIINHKRLINVLNTIADEIFPHQPDCYPTQGDRECACRQSDRKTNLKKEIARITTDHTCPQCNGNMGSYDVNGNSRVIYGCYTCDK